MVLFFKFNVLLNFILFYFMFYISFDLFRSETNIYYTRICDFFVGSSRPPYISVIHKANLTTDKDNTGKNYIRLTIVAIFNKRIFQFKDSF